MSDAPPAALVPASHNERSRASSLRAFGLLLGWELRQSFWILAVALALLTAMAAILASPARYAFLLEAPKAPLVGSLPSMPNLIWDFLEFMLSLLAVVAVTVPFARLAKTGHRSFLLALPVTRRTMFWAKLCAAMLVGVALRVGLHAIDLSTAVALGGEGQLGTTLVVLGVGVLDWATTAVGVAAALGLATGAALPAALGVEIGLGVMRYVGAWPLSEPPRVNPAWLNFTWMFLPVLVSLGLLAWTYRAFWRLEPRARIAVGVARTRRAAGLALFGAVTLGAWVYFGFQLGLPGDEVVIHYRIAVPAVPADAVDQPPFAEAGANARVEARLSVPDAPRAGELAEIVREQTARVLRSRLRALAVRGDVQVTEDGARVRVFVHFEAQLARVQRALERPGRLRMQSVAGSIASQAEHAKTEALVREVDDAKARGAYDRAKVAFDTATYVRSAVGARPVANGLDAEAPAAPASEADPVGLAAESTRVLLLTDAFVDGRDIEHARLLPDRLSPTIEVFFNRNGRERLERLTTLHVGRDLAIVIDDHIVAAPHIRSPLTDGRAWIELTMTEDEARDLAAILAAGPLPASIDRVAVERPQR